MIRFLKLNARRSMCSQKSLEIALFRNTNIVKRNLLSCDHIIPHIPQMHYQGGFELFFFILGCNKTF